MTAHFPSLSRGRWWLAAALAASLMVLPSAPAPGQKEAKELFS